MICQERLHSLYHFRIMWRSSIVVQVDRTRSLAVWEETGNQGFEALIGKVALPEHSFVIILPSIILPNLLSIIFTGQERQMRQER